MLACNLFHLVRLGSILDSLSQLALAFKQAANEVLWFRCCFHNSPYFYVFGCKGTKSFRIILRLSDFSSFIRLSQYVKERVERVKSLSSLTGYFERSVSRGRASRNALSRAQKPLPPRRMDVRPDGSSIFIILYSYGSALRVLSKYTFCPMCAALVAAATHYISPSHRRGRHRRLSSDCP